jgi:hypothetical protein
MHVGRLITHTSEHFPIITRKLWTINKVEIESECDVTFERHTLLTDAFLIFCFCEKLIERIHLFSIPPSLKTTTLGSKNKR